MVTNIGISKACLMKKPHILRGFYNIELSYLIFFHLKVGRLCGAVKLLSLWISAKIKYISSKLLPL